MNWITLSVLSAFCLACLNLLTKGILEKGVAPVVLNFWLFGLSTLGFGALSYFRGQSLQLPTNAYVLFFVVILVVLGYNDFLVRAFSEAPNPGYVQGIVSISMVVVLILSVLFFGSALTLPKFIGMALILAGALVLCLVN